MMIISIDKGRKKEEKKERCSNVLIDSYSRGLLRKEVIKKGGEREREKMGSFLKISAIFLHNMLITMK
jgi:hypothetical protein